MTFQEYCEEAGLECFEHAGHLMVDCTPVHVIGTIVDQLNIDIEERADDPHALLEHVTSVLQGMGEAFAFPDKIQIIGNRTVFTTMEYEVEIDEDEDE